MPDPSTRPQRPLSAGAVRRILDSLDNLTQGHAKTARAICDLLDEDGITTIDAAHQTITSDDPREYLRKFKNRFNEVADGALTVVFDGRRGPELYFTGSDPITDDIAEYSERQTRRHAPREELIDARATDNVLRIYLSFLEEDERLAAPCADLIEDAVKAGLRDRYRVTFFRSTQVPVGVPIDSTRDEMIRHADIAVVLLSNKYLLEENEAERVHASHPHPIIVMLENIGPSVSMEPFERRDIVPGASFIQMQESTRGTQTAKEQDLANTVVSLIDRELNKELATPRPCPPLSEEVAEALSKRLTFDPAIQLVDARAAVGTFDNRQAFYSPSRINRDAYTSDVVKRLAAWACGSDDQRAKLCALLGDLGTGKTTSTILLTRRLLDLRKAGEEAPLPIYFDLRDLSPAALADFGLRTILTQLLSNASQDNVTADDVLTTIRDEHTLIVFDGLDEILVHLSPSDGQRLTRSLLEVLALGGGDATGDNPRARLLLSCRTQYFRTIDEQFAFFDGQGRENRGAGDYLVLTLLPFDEDQIRGYLRRNVPDVDADRLLETIRSVHDLRQLASQPVLLNMIREVLLDSDESLGAGHSVRSVDLYERFVDRWLRRDGDKHCLIPEHKIQLMTHLAWQVWRSGSRTWPARWMETWMLRFLHAHPEMELDYKERMPDQWKQDFRTATFLARRGDDFAFAHSSLLEYFLARRLADSLTGESEDDALAAWDITRPSAETLVFLAELLERLSPPEQREALQRLGRVGTHAEPAARANVFAYTLRALEKRAPHPRTTSLNLSDAELSGWTINGSQESPLNLGGVSFCGARLDDASIRHALLDRVDATGASMQRALIEHCALTNATLDDADLAGTVFRCCAMDGASLGKAKRYRTQLLHSTGYHEQLGGVLTAPLSKHTPFRFLPETQIFGGYSVDVTEVEWSPDGTHILTASSKVARVWDAATREHVLTFAHTTSVEAVAWSPDGTHILTATRGGEARVWDAASGTNTLTLTHDSGVEAVAWSPDATHVLTTSDGARMWDASTGANTLTLTHTEWVWDAAWSPDGTHILTGSQDGTVHIWDAVTGADTLTLTHTAWVRVVAWSTDGKRILTGSEDGTARIWDADNGDNRLTVTHNDWVTAAAWSPDGKRILTGSLDGTARVWDATTGTNTLTLTHNDWVRAVAWSPDGTHILTGSQDGTTRIWDAATGEQVRFFITALPEGECAVLTPDQTKVIGASPNAWRWLGRYAAHPDGTLERVPAEIDGPLPPLDHGATIE